MEAENIEEKYRRRARSWRNSFLVMERNEKNINLREQEHETKKTKKIVSLFLRNYNESW
jgi:hypothetical protein